MSTTEHSPLTGRAVVTGAVTGSVAAALVAVAFGAVLGLGGQVLAGAGVAAGAAGGSLGSVLGAILRVKQSEAWELTPRPISGNCVPDGDGPGVRGGEPRED
jgi:hypothetical protein